MTSSPATVVEETDSAAEALLLVDLAAVEEAFLFTLSTAMGASLSFAGVIELAD